MKRILAYILCGVLAFSAAGCKKQQGNNKTEVDTNVTFPVEDGSVNLTYWTPLNNKVTAFATSFSDVLCYQELEKLTGIKITFQHPPVGQEGEQFNLMMASKTLPDLVYYGWGGIAGGVDKLIDDGIILRLNPYLESLAPNYNNVLNSSKAARLETQNDNGDVYMFPFLKLDEDLKFYKGLIIREDWLEKCGLDVPNTPDEWYNVLKAFKTMDPNGNGQNDEIPMVSKKMETIETLINGFGVSSDFMVKDGKVVYGPVLPEYKQALTFVKKLISEQLIDGDFFLTDDNTMDAKVISDLAGSMYGALTSHMSKYTSMMSEKNPDVSFTAVPSLKAADGNRYIFNRLLTRVSTTYGTAITKDNKHLAESIKLMDYLYGEEGSMLMNFGIEGQTYDMVDGFPKYSDNIINNPDKTPVGDMLARFVIAPTNGSFVQDPRYLQQILVYPQQKTAPATWSKELVTDRILPAVTLTSDEQTAYSALINDITTYKDEMTNKFIIGTENLDKFDAFVETINQMKIDEAIKIQQAAYDRYISRSAD